MGEIDGRRRKPDRQQVVSENGGVRAVYRGPMQVRLRAPSGTLDTDELLETFAGLGVDVADISPETLRQLNDRLSALMERLLADDDAAAAFDRDPGSFRDVLGDELADTLVILRRRVRQIPPPISAPGSDESALGLTLRPRRRVVMALDPDVEERADALRQDLIEWALARRRNIVALEKSPDQTIERRYADEPEAVRRALLRGVEKGAHRDA